MHSLYTFSPSFDFRVAGGITKERAYCSTITGKVASLSMLRRATLKLAYVAVRISVNNDGVGGLAGAGHKPVIRALAPAPYPPPFSFREPTQRRAHHH